ncbi:hypothetical protein FQ186_18155 [Pseudomonas sp. ANT_H14]|nr:hypothetical protein FQ182_08200 [Pseudomonas sp. ANT_H4]KAA0951112.1 hypothetical protein FQ186_18155 [Pseudomonas sp. ANT_H14]
MLSGKNERWAWKFRRAAKANADQLSERAPPVGASLLAMVVNDDAGFLDECGALRFFASKN